jgi:hypothetical protein
MNNQLLYSALATKFLSLPQGDNIVQLAKDELKDKSIVGSFLSSVILEERAFGKHELFRKLSLRFQKMTLILDVVNDYKRDKQFVNNFQIVL